MEWEGGGHPRGAQTCYAIQYGKFEVSNPLNTPSHFQTVYIRTSHRYSIPVVFTLSTPIRSNRGVINENKKKLLLWNGHIMCTYTVTTVE